MKPLKAIQESILSQLHGLGVGDLLTPRMKAAAAAIALSASTGFVAGPAQAQDQGVNGKAATVGGVIGAAAGNIIGKMTGSNRTVTTVLGAGVGAVIGAQQQPDPQQQILQGGYSANPQYGGTAHSGPPAPLDPARLAGFKNLSQRFFMANDTASAAQRLLSERQVDLNLAGPGEMRVLQDEVSRLSALTRQAISDRNSLGRQYLVAYSQAADAGYSLAPVNDDAQRIYDIMRLSDRQSYGNVRAAAGSYIDRINARHLPRF